MKEQNKYSMIGVLIGIAIGILLMNVSMFFLPVGISLGYLFGMLIGKKH